jgi:hypothetical protein
MTSPTEALAALRDGNPRDRKPLRLKLESGLSIEAPGARYLAEVFALPLLDEVRDVYRSGAVILARPSGSDAVPDLLTQQDLTQELRTALLALPERSRAEAGRPYRDLRLFVSEAERATVDTYLRDVVAAVRSLAPKWSPPKARPVRGPAKTPTEIKAAQRERKRAAEAASAREWLESYLANDEEPPTPGARIGAPALYELAAEAIEDYVDGGMELEDGTPYRVPGPRQFYAVADEVLGARRYSHGERFYVVPEPETAEEQDPMHQSLADAVFDRVVEKIAASVEDEIRERLRSGDRLGALLLQRNHHCATGTDGAAIDLAAVRANRSR